MAHLIEVAFKGNRKDFFIWEQDEIPPLKAPVVVEADRGEDVGRVHAVGDAAAHRNAGASHGYGSGLPARRARRLAGAEDLRRLAELRAQDDDARRRAQERVKANGLEMKVSDAEWQWDRKKLTFYFTAEKRVDFRTLVRELAVHVPHPHRAQADRRARRGQAPGRRGPLRTAVLLGGLAARAAAREPGGRQGPAAVAQPDADLRRLRAADVLPALRARVLREERKRFPKEGQRARHGAGRGEGADAWTSSANA